MEREVIEALVKAQGSGAHPAEEARLLHRLMFRRVRAGQHFHKPIHERLLSRVVWGASDCWHYCGGRSAFGYGRIMFDGLGRYAHRISYELFVGPIPHGLFVLHTCDNPSCVNPEHLWLGNNTDNRRDCLAKGRANAPKGDNHWSQRGRTK
jgi:hypothetical protein